MKKVKTIVKTLLFSAFMTVVVSTAGYNVKLEENAVAVCCSEYPDSESNMTGY